MVAGPDGCWLWTGPPYGGKGNVRYSRVGEGGREGRTLLGHRVSYEHFVGPIPEGLEIDHLCRRPLCVNPKHLEPVLHAENVDRGAKANQTHCMYGHEFTDENTALRDNGTRKCRKCDVRRVLASRKRRLASA